MVTHTRNLCSAFDPSKVHTHSSEHTWSSGQPMLRRPGSSWGFGALLKGTSVVVLRVERALALLKDTSVVVLRVERALALLKDTSVVVLRVERALVSHSPHLQFLPARDSNSQPFDYESDSNH